ncbi:MAG: hypothetical protein QMD09_14205, partial [Desulfatibacillaceae bacterium]|nr:hypothetical protein [Desulfatibacillaceae bacterium]
METQANKTLELLEKHPLTQQLKADEAAATLARRKAAAARIQALKTEREATLPGLIQAHKRALEAHEAAKKALGSLEADCRAAYIAKVNKADHYQRGNAKATDVLHSTASPELDSAIAWFREKIETIRHQKPINQQRLDGRRDPVNDRQALLTFTNADAINKALAYCRQAIPALEALKMEPDFDAGKIEALKKSIPDTNELSEVRHSKKDSGWKPRPVPNSDPVVERLLSRS